MNKKTTSLFLTLFILFVSAAYSLIQVSVSYAKEPQRVAVFPFAIHSDRDLSFLREGILDMLASRLYRKDKVTVIEKHSVRKAMGDYDAPVNLEYATRLGQNVHADYVLFGSLTFFGESISLDATMVGLKKAEPPVTFFFQTKGMDAVIPEIDKLAREVSAKLSGRPLAETEPVYAPAEPPKPPQPEMQVGTEAAPINPEFKKTRQMGVQDASFWKSRPFKTEIRGMDIGDVDGDGQNEIVLLEGIDLTVYDFREGALRKLATHSSSDGYRFLAVDVADMNGNGKAEIFASRVSKDSVTSVVLEMDGSRLKPLVASSPWLFRVMSWPDKGKILLGQRMTFGSYLEDMDLITSYFESGIYALSWKGAEYVKSEEEPLMDISYVFIYNFAMGDLSGDGKPEIVLIDKDDRLRILDNEGEELHRTTENFGGTLNFVITNPDAAKSIDKDYLFLPGRILITDLDGNGRNEIIINQNTSSTGGLTERFRAYSDGKIVSLSWTGLSLDRNWESGKLSGCLCDYQVKDLDNDGERDLVVAMLQQRGAAVFREARSLVVSYKLTTGQGK